MERACPHDRMCVAALNLAVELFETRKNAAHTNYRIASVSGPASVRGDAFSCNFDPFESLVPDRDLHVRGFADDCRIRLPFGDQRIGTDARVLLVDNRSNDDTSRFQAAVS